MGETPSQKTTLLNPIHISYKYVIIYEHSLYIKEIDANFMGV